MKTKGQKDNFAFTKIHFTRPTSSFVADVLPAHSSILLSTPSILEDKWRLVAWTTQPISNTL